MEGHLICVVIDAGPAAYLKPVLEEWLVTPPEFSWSIRLGEKAAEVLGDLPGLKAHRGANLERDEKASVADGDALLVSAGGWPVEKTQIMCSRERCIPTVQFVDACYNYARRLLSGDVWTLPDRLLLVTEQSVAEAVAEGVPESICTVVGHPSWGNQTTLPPSDCDDILFVGAPVRRDYGDTLGYTEVEAWEMLTDVLHRDTDFDGALYYAKHPEQSIDSLPSNANLVDYDAGNLEAYDTITGMFSAPLVDAYLAGRRSLSLQPDATDIDMFFLSRQGFLPRITRREALASALATPPPDSASFSRELRGSSNRLNQVLNGVLAA
jgi:hypothetical protein